MTDTNWQPTFADDAFQDGVGPKFRALAHMIRQAIRAGELAPGDRLPPMRDLAWRLQVTPGTVARAYQVVAAEGIVESHVGRGSFVAAQGARQAPLQPLIDDRNERGRDRPLRADEVAIDLRSPKLPDLGQAGAIRQAFRRMADQSGEELLDYTPVSGDRDCTAALTDWIGPRAAGEFGPPDIVLTHGCQSAILLILSMCLAGERPRILCEALCYPGLRHAARLLRAEVAPVAQDGQGMLPDELDRAARQTGARVVFLTPSAQNPTTGRMNAERRAAIIDVARRHDLQVIEDESYTTRPGALRGADGPPPLRELAPERVWQLVGLAKLLSAGLRFGAIICPTGMGGQARLAAQHSHFGVARPLTVAVTELLRDPATEDLCRAILADFEARRNIATEVMAGTGLVSLAELPFLWLPLPARWRPSVYAQAAADRGILVRPADEFAASAGSITLAGSFANAVRIGLAGHMPHATLRRALTELRRLHDAPPQDDMVA
ncbi:PLP-dependent aminotransferase family protein [Paracoccus sp. TK19116]|uniref:PLP-dependent aminotransferase family protein n=1 Tax=Paracoccus albicereus TaxID=2922394 RepID=A0ABT1MNY6_9RHOB|nr:PLP-dependent aminotransferase family protein [Paracoccus albicereus]MCQ0969997.1 PLP-dependent aminotransferase family protein [Paracoccus albicereus]